MALSPEAILEKNKLAAAQAWILLFEITINSNVIRLARAHDKVVWPSAGGNTYWPYPIELDRIAESSRGELPKFKLKVGDVERVLEPWLQDYAGAVGDSIRLLVVQSEHLDLTDPEVDESFEILETQSDAEWITFTLGLPSPFTKRFPSDRYLPNTCRHAFKGIPCGYGDRTIDNAETTCDFTLLTCRDTMHNEKRFGGSPGIATGIYS